MKKLHLSDIRIIEKLLTGQTQKLVILDPENRLIPNDSMIHVHLVRDISQLTAISAELDPTSYNLVLFSKVDQIPEGSSPRWILSSSKWRSSFVKNYTRQTWHYINNPDETIRWIYNQYLKKPTFLNLCNSSDKLAYYIIRIFHIIFLLRLQRVFNSGKINIYHQYPLYIEKQLEGITYDGYTIYTGNPGESRKVVLELHLKNQTFAFGKFALNESGQALLHDEKKTLTDCNSLMLSRMVYPQVVSSTDNLLILSAIKPQVHHENTTLDLVHLDAIKELYYQTDETINFTSSPLFAEIYENICQINPHPSNGLEEEMVTQIQSKLIDLLLSFEEGKNIEVSLAHNDFTPWNTFINQNKLHTYDWELARNGYPLLHDFFHFIFQSKIMIFQQGYAEIMEEIKYWEQNPWMAEFLEDFNLDLSLYYRLYLLVNVSHYMKHYSNQQELYPHECWMVNIWHEALQDVMIEQFYKPFNQIFV